MAIFLARQGRRVTVATSGGPTCAKSTWTPAARSTSRSPTAGIHALAQAGVYADVEPLLIPMRGRMLHAVDGALHLRAVRPAAARSHLLRLAPGPDRASCSTTRNGSTAIEPRFLQAARSLDFERDELVMLDEVSGDTYDAAARAADRRGWRGLDGAPGA